MPTAWRRPLDRQPDAGYEKALLQGRKMLFRRGWALFWTIWYGLTALSNVCDGLKELGVLGAAWSWASGNLAQLRQATGITDPQAPLPHLLLAAAAGAELTLCACFAASGLAARHAPQRLQHALLAGTALWACFLIADEICVFYLPAGTHWGLLCAHMLGLIYLQTTQT